MIPGAASCPAAPPHLLPSFAYCPDGTERFRHRIGARWVHAGALADGDTAQPPAPAVRSAVRNLVVQIECMHHGPVQIAFQVIQQFADPATERAVVMVKTLSRFATDGWSSPLSGPTCTSVQATDG